MYWVAFSNTSSEYPASCTGSHLTRLADGICQMLALFFQSRTGLHMAIIGPALCTGVHSTILVLCIHPSPACICQRFYRRPSIMHWIVFGYQLYVLDRICQCLFCTSSLMYWIAVDKAPPALVYSSLQLFPSSLRWFKFLLFVRSYCYPALDSDDPCPEDQEDFSAEEAIPLFLQHMG